MAVLWKIEILYPEPILFCLHSRDFLFFQMEKSNKSEQAGERRRAPIVSKNGELGGEGVSKKREEGRVPCLTPSPCSLVFALARSFAHFACFFGHACYACYTVFIISHLNFITEITRQEAARQTSCGVIFLISLAFLLIFHCRSPVLQASTVGSRSIPSIDLERYPFGTSVDTRLTSRALGRQSANC